MSVIDLAARRKEVIEQLRGPARCVACASEWEAVSQVGVVSHLECPTCHRECGVRLGLCEPQGARWVCHCGNELFYLLPDGCQCLLCGVIAKGF